MARGRWTRLARLVFESCAPALQGEQTIKSSQARLRLISPLYFSPDSSFFLLLRLSSSLFLISSASSSPTFYLASTISFNFSPISVSYEVHAEWIYSLTSPSILGYIPSVGYAYRSWKRTRAYKFVSIKIFVPPFFPLSLLLCVHLCLYQMTFFQITLHQR